MNLITYEIKDNYSIIGEEAVTGNVMQFCLHYGDGERSKGTESI